MFNIRFKTSSMLGASDMNQTTFHWQQSDMTPELLELIGWVTIQWSIIDNEVTRILEPFWLKNTPNERMPRSFDKRIQHLTDSVRPLYADEPEEERTFLWFVHRLKDVNGRRDQLAHGIPGTIKKGRREYVGLMVPFPSNRTKYVPMSLAQIKKLASALTQIRHETWQVGSAINAVLAASSGNRSVWRDPDGWTRITMDNRSPMLPRDHPPPPTFSP